jgi:hypothetical protein
MADDRAAPAGPSGRPPPRNPTPTLTTTLTSLPRDVLGDILLRVPHSGPAAVCHRSLAAVIADPWFRRRHSQRHPPRVPRRPLGAWSISDRAAMAMAMASYAVALRDLRRCGRGGGGGGRGGGGFRGLRSAGGSGGVAAAPALQAGGVPPSLRVRVLGGAGAAAAGGGAGAGAGGLGAAMAPLAVAE